MTLNCHIATEFVHIHMQLVLFYKIKSRQFISLDLPLATFSKRLYII